jgi:hypothetical protein
VADWNEAAQLPLRIATTLEGEIAVRAAVASQNTAGALALTRAAGGPAAHPRVWAVAFTGLVAAAAAASGAAIAPNGLFDPPTPSPLHALNVPLSQCESDAFCVWAVRSRRWAHVALLRSSMVPTLAARFPPAAVYKCLRSASCVPPGALQRAAAVAFVACSSRLVAPPAGAQISLADLEDLAPFQPAVNE